MFPACSREFCFYVIIYEDTRVEYSESFGFTVTHSQGLGDECSIAPVNGEVIIHDNDGITAVCPSFM